jgi:putative PIN family toxin of toxin-antitoxin system
VTSATLDTNVYISALQYSGAGARMICLAKAGKLRIDTSDVILDEVVGVLRDKFAWDGYRLHFARAALAKIANRVTPVEAVAVTADPDDDRVLECAKAAGSDYIVTEDKDLLRLGEFEGMLIVRMSEFMKRLVEPGR